MIAASLSERVLPATQVNFSVSRAQLEAVGVTASATRLVVRATRVGWPAGVIGSVEVDTATGWGARFNDVQGGTPERGGPDQVFELTITDGVGAPVPVLDMAPLDVRVVLAQSIRTAITVEAL